MHITNLAEFDNHEMILFLHDKESGLKGFISIHNTALGPATGGTRYLEYKDESDGLRDALRLSRAMTYKCALAGVPFGGGKGVIIANDVLSRPAVFRKYGEYLNRLGGNFSTGEDVGITDDDVREMGAVSKHVNGLRGAGELGRWAAFGVHSAMQAAVWKVFGEAEIKGRTVAIQGLGKVGFELAKLIYRDGGNVTAADINSNAVQKAVEEIPNIKIVHPDEIYDEEADVFSPCALGGILNTDTVPRLRAQIICGGANNQLEQPEIGELLHRSEIIYIPDYVANAGGLINVVSEMNRGGYSRSWVEKKIVDIGITVVHLLEESDARGLPPEQIAEEWGRERIKAGAGTLHPDS